MKKLLFLLLFSINSYAAGVGSATSYMYDSDNNSWFHANSWYMFNEVLGVRYGKTQYYTNTTNDSANRVSGLVNFKHKNILLNGELGASKLGDKTFMIGDISAYKVINKYATFFAGIDGDVVDSDSGVDKKITYRGYSTGVELYYDKFGVTGIFKESDFSDGNNRSGYVFKTYYVPMDGLSIYVSSKNYNNSLEDNVNYFSPKDLQRNSLGVTYRYLLGEYLISGYAELGYQDTDNFRQNANAFKIAVSGGFNKFWQWKISYLTDIQSTSNYRYNMISGEIFINL